ncbi:hypothetical protein P154DRAFT_537705 [Amniculicola lignicola CBS 123094]|uniref:WW domain-containing protein n=1 Tax=Amniculicola lignicola CBS 123094 TaxID=1392246 RepID=A0A6A5W7N8_9PLEO|nr:hypothetical protein P154DRAFT_537705 [Amniculicola lignicola CBS 123094]
MSETSSETDGGVKGHHVAQGASSASTSTSLLSSSFTDLILERSSVSGTADPPYADKPESTLDAVQSVPPSPNLVAHLAGIPWERKILYPAQNENQKLPLPKQIPALVEELEIFKNDITKDLPDGWTAQWHSQARKYYYVNILTGECQWTRPTKTAADSASDHAEIKPSAPKNRDTNEKQYPRPPEKYPSPSPYVRTYSLGPDAYSDQHDSDPRNGYSGYNRLPFLPYGHTSPDLQQGAYQQQYLPPQSRTYYGSNSYHRQGYAQAAYGGPPPSPLRPDMNSRSEWCGSSEPPGVISYTRDGGNPFDDPPPPPSPAIVGE